MYKSIKIYERENKRYNRIYLLVPAYIIYTYIKLESNISRRC